MADNLLGLTSRELLKKFGAGNHKPGSGSAAAYQGMISSQLLVTVIELTNSDDKRRLRYAESLPKLLDMQTQINDRIFPELAELFEEDSIQFGKTIDLRGRRDAATQLEVKNDLARKALHELKTSIDIPLKIANLCVELSNMAAFVFDKAFQSARGDSQVALSGAVSAIAGCLSIVQLNLLPFGSDEYRWIQEVSLKCDLLKKQHDELNQIANSKVDVLASAVEAKASFYKQVDHLLNDVRSREKLTNANIDDFATDLQNLIWVNRRKIWGKVVPVNSRQILNPAIIFKNVLGYEYDNTRDLEVDYVDDVLVDIAGIIDQERKLVQISNHTSPQVQKFTAAHELGHALLHKQTILHRDIPFDGSVETRKRPIEEIQADRFASSFLMPKKLVEQSFMKLFHTSEFHIDANTTFMLTGDTTVDLRKDCKNLDGLCRRLAITESYNGEFFISMSELFKVSKMAMAIRLKQLSLVNF